MATQPSGVSFLVAGVQKGGTTALFDYLRDHPALCLPAVKEVHFFDDETGVDWSAPDYGAYHAPFLAERPAPGAVWGEATPIYTYWPNAIERIRAYNPAMKLIVVLRDPVERAWSHWRMERARGAETLAFADCIRAGRARVADAADGSGAHRVHSYVERGFYGAQIERLFANFPRQQVLLMRSNDLRGYPARILRNACDFLQIPAFETVIARESHVGVKAQRQEMPTAADVSLLRSLYVEDQKKLKSLTGISFDADRFGLFD